MKYPPSILLSEESKIAAIHLIQECSELTKALTKMIMFGEIAVLEHEGGSATIYENWMDCMAEFNDVSMRMRKLVVSVRGARK